jgi:predicted DNA-binding transcriptional regulator AlpA
VTIRERVQAAAVEELPDLAAEIEAGRVELEIRVKTLVAKTPLTGADHDRNLSAQEAAARLGMSDSWLYKHPDLPFVVKIGGRTLYSERGLEKWNRSRQRRP